jgi:molybdopterin-guanine dinucleotide biosynthesis protein A
MVKNHISGVILAGGAGRRFGGIQKARLQIGGKTIISRIIETIGDLFPEIIIVTNTPSEFSDCPFCKITGDHFAGQGPLAGIHAALKSSSFDAVFVFAGDMPLLDKKIVERQIDAYDKSDFEIFIPKMGVLIESLHSIFRKTILEDLEKFLSEHRDRSIRDFISAKNTGYLELEDSPETKRAFTNINSLSDITRIEADFYL